MASAAATAEVVIDMRDVGTRFGTHVVHSGLNLAVHEPRFLP